MNSHQHSGVTCESAERDTERNSTPISDLRVVELGNIVAAPFASSILADLGADVVKIEQPRTGDIIRSSGEAGNAIFNALNRNKRSVALDLKTPEDKEALDAILEKTDVFIENLGRGVPERLGIGYEDVRADNPGLIYLSIKGFQEGPYGDRAGMDVVAEAMSGLMSVTGEPGHQPVRVGTSIADMAAALYGIIGVLVALRERDATGEGQRVDGTLFESATHLMNYWVTYADLYDRDPDPLGASHPGWGLYDVFELSGGWVFIGVVSEPHWDAVCDSLKIDVLQADERFETAELRRTNKRELKTAVQHHLDERNRTDVLNTLLEAGVPVAPVNQPSDLLDDPGLSESGVLSRFESDETTGNQSVQSILAPVMGLRFGPEQYRDPPELGEHTTAVLDELRRHQVDG